MQVSGFFTKEEGLGLAGSDLDMKLFGAIHQGILHDALLDKAAKAGEKVGSES